MKVYRKRDFPLDQVRRWIEPGPIVLVSSAWRGQRDIMTMGWHMMMEFSPALFGCIISSANYTFDLVRRSRECVVNVPTADLLDTVVAIGNSTGAEIDKFAEFGLTPERARKVAAPMIGECFASFECRLADARLVAKYNLFIWEVVKAHVAPSPRHPRTVHYRGDGEFMVAGEIVSRRRLFKASML